MIQRFPIYFLPPHMHSFPAINIPHRSVHLLQLMHLRTVTHHCPSKSAVHGRAYCQCCICCGFGHMCNYPWYHYSIIQNPFTTLKILCSTLTYVALLGVVPQREGSPVRFPVRALAWALSLVPGGVCMRSNQSMFLFLSPSLPFSLKIYK